jgi:dATP pyrophosphohydrolase
VAAYRRPESVIVVVHAGRRILLLRRVRPFPFWQSVTGSLEEDENPRTTASREVREETGLRADGNLIDTGTEREFTIDPRWRDRYAPGVHKNLEHEFRLSLAEPADIVIDPREHSEYRWTDIDTAIELVWSSTNKAALRALRSEL